MARRPRCDTPGSWHHVINRAIAKRPYFETRSDKRYFLARLASEVRAGRLEVHAFSLMTTHFHLLVRSPIGEMSEAMRRTQCAYSRHFNRLRRRDGPLIRARFFSKRVGTEAYRGAVVRYIDANPVRAGVVPSAADHEFGSARHFMGRRRCPWLSAAWVEERAREVTGSDEFGPSTYLAAFGPHEGDDHASLCKMIEMRLASARDLDPLDDLIGKTPPQVRRWMIRKAQLADGMEPGLPVCGPCALFRAVSRRKRDQGEWLVDRESHTWRGSQLARSGLLRDLCGLPISRVAQLEGISPWLAHRRLAVHREVTAEGREHATAVGAIAHEAVAATVPGPD